MNASLPHNSLEPRTRGAIALGMMGNDTVRRVLMTLNTGKLIRRAHARIVPMTTEVIARVNYLGREETSLFTFTNRRGEEVGERILNQVKESIKGPIEHNAHEIGNSGDGSNSNLDVVDDVTGVDSPYEQYVDEWNNHVP